MFLLPCWYCKRGRCLSEYAISSLGTHWLGKAAPFLPSTRWSWTAWLSLHLLSVCFNYVDQVKVQHSGMFCDASDTAAPAPGLAYSPSLQNLWRKPALFTAICVSEHLAELFRKQFWMRRGYVVNQDYFKLLKSENLGICFVGTKGKGMINKGISLTAQG